MTDVTIYGAGQAGMIAAINLAREGCAVVVHDREDGYGGSSIYNPSAHTTPIDVQRTSEYVGVDLSPVFHSCKARLYLHDTGLMWPGDLYTVERGNRDGSLDTLLFAECEKLGVRFEFGSTLKGGDIPGLPKNSMVACGLTPSVYEMLGIPYLRWHAYLSRGEIGFSDYSFVWFDECITEYGYLSSVNNYYFNLLFSTEPVGRDALDKYRDFMRRNEGLEQVEWEKVSGAVPVARPDNPRLYAGDLILAGTIAGAMDPFGWFGILGALISGKVAALAVTDPRRAGEEFKRFNRNFRAMYYFKNQVFYRIRRHVGAIESLIHRVGPERAQAFADFAFDRRVPGGIPGFTEMLGCY